MFRIEQIIEQSSGGGFEKTALELFRYQADRCEPYGRYLELVGCRPGAVDRIEKIPFLPISLFKSHKIYCADREPEMVFTSSTTGGGLPSKHYMARLSDYEKVFRTAFELFYGSPGKYGIYALLPSYLEREGSSLVYMADKLIKSARGGGFFLDDHQTLLARMKADSGPKILLGVTYALLDLAESYNPDLGDTIVMETGGMKGRRREMSKKELHEVLCDGLGVASIHSEYGMAELTTQAYSTGGGIFRTPHWMKVLMRDVNDPFDVRLTGRGGGINIIDLANVNSCSFIQTEDTGSVFPNGTFSISGRIDRSEIRGCNLLVQ